MPKMELLFKKVYSNIYSKSNESQDSGNVKNYSLIKNINKAYEFTEGFMHITAETNDNHKISHLYSNMNQTLPNASDTLFIQKIANEEINFGVDMKKCLKFDIMDKRCIWGSLVIFVIKMNFID